MKKIILMLLFIAPFAQASEIHGDGQSGVDSMANSDEVVLQITGDTAKQMYGFLNIEAKQYPVKKGKNIFCRKNILGNRQEYTCTMSVSPNGTVKSFN